MADEQVSLTSLVLIVVLGGLAIRYLFFPSSAAASGPVRGRDAAASSRAREAAVERIQQMFPQLDRRAVLWELQRSSGNIAMTTERILTGRTETVSFPCHFLLPLRSCRSLGHCLYIHHGKPTAAFPCVPKFQVAHRSYLPTAPPF